MRQLRLYQGGNSSFRKNTEFKQHGLWLALGWVTIDGNALALVKSQDPRNGASKRQKKPFLAKIHKKLKKLTKQALRV